MLKRTRWITGPLALFDLGLGLIATLWPDIYASLMHGPLHPDAESLIQRTGILWLVFSACEFIAFAKAPLWPTSVFAVALLRLMDVPADIVYGQASPSLTFLGRSSLVLAPVFNLIVGMGLLVVWRKHR